MMETTTPQFSKDRITSHLYFASLYFVTVGVLYLWGYWSTFGINILEYLSLTDVLKATAYPIVTALVLTAIGAVIGEGLTNSNVFRNSLPLGGERNTKIGPFLRRLAPYIVTLYILGTGSLLVFGPIQKWNVLPILLAIPIFMFLENAKLFERAIPHARPRSIIIYLLAVLPPLAYGRGVLAANSIQTGQAFTYTTSAIPGYRVANEPLKQLRLLGHANETIFLLDPTKASVIVLKLQAGEPLILAQYHRPRKLTNK